MPAAPKPHQQQHRNINLFLLSPLPPPPSHNNHHHHPCPTVSSSLSLPTFFIILPLSTLKNDRWHSCRSPGAGVGSSKLHAIAESRMLQMSILRTRRVASNLRNCALVKGSPSKFHGDQKSSEASILESYFVTASMALQDEYQQHLTIVKCMVNYDTSYFCQPSSFTMPKVTLTLETSGSCETTEIPFEMSRTFW